MSIFSLLLTISLGILIFGWAFYQIIQLFKKSKQGACNACSSGCQAKQLANAAKKKKDTIKY
ncbi:FeoB-associated Cys-rich membrane protein [Carnobacterium maltaromaticum]|uniref:FeoB-associated Cys-rich membrane protein n=1 Tax=Carnobacterium maltaromaticum TaxID=2751 RepID=UPI000C7600FB|nr:FeoB-associated Cys-rich membrane protein [Carnobacterium maltaromaticum]PLS34687.1 FeoB-associated Cys-rich membrane protein [Carnobacterium maltaromaticum]PLS36505.1 FeoB-associated Cys-rich membrane protein [Carnobacterium maltaromaticum]PLS37320.1 FeoB-associated Cys-rich membrane protein [Carnobacterium maltaromaticum]PLS43536.1 FeoB-associated Cys-rich membrane protein [Carnobacterium maltaromaticum]PLS43881.1 FeoB-associated Cys-rich membrane protein [Carnobacterium maltaromaticum]